MRPGPSRCRQWAPAWLALSVAILLTATGCANLVAGRPVSVFDDPYRVAGLPVSSGPSGLRDDAPPPRREVENGSGDTVDEVAVQAVLGRDFPVVQGAAIMGAVVFLAVSLLIDLLYGWVDPRLRAAGHRA